MKRIYSIILAFFFANLVSAQVGVGTTTPGTTLDVNGALTLRETAVAVSSNACTIPADVSSVRLTGAATGAITVTVPAPPNAGQRLTIFNNTTGGYPAVVNGFSVLASKTGEFIYSNGNWQSFATAGAGIIPYASGAPVVVTTIAGGLAGTGGLIGFGNSFSGLSVAATPIDLSGGAGVNLNFAFTVPRNGLIRSLSVNFSNVAALALIGTTVTLKGQLYINNGADNLYTPVPGVSVDLAPSLTGIISLGSQHSASVNGLAIPVTANSRVLLVVSATATGLSLVNTITGYVSGGVTFD